MSNSHTTLFGLTSRVEVVRRNDSVTQRGRAFFKYLIASWITISGGAILLDLTAQTWLGSLLLAIPVVFTFVAQNYPAELSEAQLEKLRQDDDVLRIYGYEEHSRNNDNPAQSDSLVESLARTQYRLKQYRQEGASDKELMEEVYDELTDLGFYVTHKQLRDWTEDLWNNS